MDYYLNIGSNMGERRDNLYRAVVALTAGTGGSVTSRIVESEPWGFESENTFLNAAVCVETELSPNALLRVTQQIERDMGRTEKSTINGQQSTVTYHDRIIDIDILLYDDLHINTPKLTIPHPHMYERDFVLIPLREILPQKELKQ